MEVIGSWLVLKHRYMRRTSYISMVEALTLILLFNNRIPEFSLVPRLSLLGTKPH